MLINIMEMDIYEYLDSAANAVKKLEKARENRQKIADEVTLLEKKVSTIRKAMSDEISLSIKKRREELISGYQQQLLDADRNLKKYIDIKEAARTAGKKERISRETLSLRKKTAELEKEYNELIHDSRVSGICGKNWFYHLFLPQTVIDFLIILFIYIIAGFVIPYICINNIAELNDSLKEMLIYMLVGVFLTLNYMIIHMKVCVPNKDIMDEINIVARKIINNKKEIKSIQSAIMSDSSEEYYHLDDYNYDIAKAEAAKEDIQKKKNDAINNFDLVTKKVIADEIAYGYDEQLTEADILLETRKGDLEIAEKKVKSINAVMMEEYVPRLGQENLSSERIAAIRQLVEERNLDSLAEAVNLVNGHVC